jgi:glycosyltransferase involved in cell wall biosynthesis
LKAFRPRVSIVIPVYNGSKYLREAIDSALAQTYKNIEIIVSNDGSNDNGATEKVAKSYGKKIIYLGKKENGGASTALNAAIKVMTGDYFSWLSHDDMYYPNKIQRQVEELAKLKDKNTIMMSDLDGINEKRKKIYQANYKNHLLEHPLRKQSLIHPVVYNQTHGCTLLIPKICFEEVGLFDVGERVAHDFEYFYRIFQKYPHKLVPEVLVTARDTSNRMGRRAKPRAATEYSRLYIKILESLSAEDIRLLAKDELALLSDMWSFFKAAGYIPAYEYASTRITEHAQAFCAKQPEEYLSRQAGQYNLSESLDRLKQQLTLVFDDSDQALKYVDKIMQAAVGDEIKDKALGTNIDRAISLQDMLHKAGYKLSAAYLLKRLVTILAKYRMTSRLEKLITHKITGDKKFLTNQLINQLVSRKGSNKARIAFCSTHWLTGGMERVMSIIFSQLADTYEIFLITPYDGRDGDIPLPPKVHHIKMTNLMFYTNYDGAILSIATMLDVDILVGFYNLFEKQLDLYGLCHEAGIKTIASNHENFFYPYVNYSLHETAFKRLETYRNVDAVLWPTNYSAAVCGLDCPNSYLMPDPNTYDIVDLKPNTDEKTIICVGRFNDYVKRIDRILQCFKLVQDKLPSSKLMIVGDCDRQKKNDLFNGKSIADMMFELDIDENNVTFTGKVSNVDDYYKRSNVLMLTSTSEGFGMVITEAACFGVPSVCNNYPGLEDLVIDKKTGYIVEQDDILGMSERIVDILSDDILAKNLAAEAKKHVVKFKASVISNKWAFLIDELLKHNNPVATRQSLRKKLGYNIDNQPELSKIIFSELNEISKKLAQTPAVKTEIIPGRRAYIKTCLVLTVKEIRTAGILSTTRKMFRNIKRLTLILWKKKP